MKKKYNMIERARQQRKSKVEIINVETGEIVETTLEKASYTLGYTLVKTAVLCRWADKAKEVIEKGYYIRWKKKEKKKRNEEEKAEVKYNIIQIQHDFF